MCVGLIWQSTTLRVCGGDELPKAASCEGFPVPDGHGGEEAGQRCLNGASPDEKTWLSRARHARLLPSAESILRRYFRTVRTHGHPGPSRIQLAGWQVGIQGFWSEGPEGEERRPLPLPPPPGQTWVAARDVSGVCALAVYFITASKIKLGPDGM